MSSSLVIETNDGQIFEVDREVACRSDLFRNLLLHTGDKEEKEEAQEGSTKKDPSTKDDSSGKVPSFVCKKVDGPTMKRVLEWLVQHKTDTEVITAHDMAFKERPLDTWDAAFFRDLPYEELADLIIAANYLDINNLMYYTAKAIAANMAGMSTVQMRAYAGIDWNGEISELATEVDPSSLPSDDKDEEKKN